jgi:hypothetical protein
MVAKQNFMIATYLDRMTNAMTAARPQLGSVTTTRVTSELVSLFVALLVRDALLQAYEASGAGFHTLNW